jgi:hypothetical protein
MNPDQIEELLRNGWRAEPSAALEARIRREAARRVRRGTSRWGALAVVAALLFVGLVTWLLVTPRPVAGGAGTPAQAQEDDVDGWIKKLSDADLTAREDATVKLIEAGARAQNRVRALLAAADADVRVRARRILDALPPEYERVLELDSREQFALAPDGNAAAIYDGKGLFSVVDLPGGAARFARDTGANKLKRRPSWTSAGLIVPLGHGAVGKVDPRTGNSDPNDVVQVRTSSDTPVVDDVIPLESGDMLLVSSRQLFIYSAVHQRAFALPEAAYGIATPDAHVILALDARNGMLATFQTRGSWKCRARAKVGEGATWLLAPPDFSRVTIGFADGTLTHFNPLTLVKTSSEQLGLGAVCWMSMRGDGAWYAVGTQAGTLHLVSAETLKPVASIDLGGEPKFVAMSTDGSTVAASVGGKIKIYRRK